MTKVVFFTDFHAHLFEDFAKPDPEYGNDRFRAQIFTLQKVFDIAYENDAVVVFGGDLFHKRAKLDDIVFNKVFGVFAKNQDIPTYLIRGNHDSRSNTTDTEHWLEPFKYLPHVTVIDQPNWVVTDYDDNSIAIFGIPYSDDVPHLKHKIAEFAETAEEDKGVLFKHTLLVGHIGVDGSEVGRYSHRLEGAFNLNDLHHESFDYIALGHYHKRQFLGGLDHVFYGGNTIQTSFSDEGQDKGVMLIDFEKGGKPEFIPIENKKFITLTEIDENTQEIVDNHYVRFILPPDKAQEVEVFKEETDNIRVELQKEYKVETRIDISMESNEEEIVRAYTEEFYPEVTDLAIDVLKEAQTID